MGNPAFDTLKYAQALEESGINKKQAEAQSNALKLVLVENAESLATKGDIESLRKDTKSEIESLRKDTETMEQRLLGKMNLMYWILALIAFDVVVPHLNKLFGG